MSAVFYGMLRDARTTPQECPSFKGIQPFVQAIGVSIFAVTMRRRSPPPTPFLRDDVHHRQKAGRRLRILAWAFKIRPCNPQRDARQHWLMAKDSNRFFHDTKGI